MIFHALTLSRLMLFPFIFQSIYNLDIKTSCFLTIYAIFSDVLDGYFARLLKQDSVFGGIFDVIADKCFLYSAAIALFLVRKKTIFLCLILLWFTRDFILSSLFFLKKPRFKSLISGKIYTTIQFFFIFFSVFWLNFNDTAILSAFFIGVFLLLGVNSIVAYYGFFTNNK